MLRAHHKKMISPPRQAPLAVGLLFAIASVGVGACGGAPQTTDPAIVAADPQTHAPSAPAMPHVAESPLAAASNEWTWIDVPDTHCANGSSTGIGVNVRPNATHLVVFLEGGGACVDGEQCWGAPTAVHIASGYGVAQFGSDVALGMSLFDRDSAMNPFGDASYVFIPYCTGDLHAGDNVATYDVDGVATPTYHHGAHNVHLDLQMLRGAFPSVDHVWLAGQSAGGFGTLFHHDEVARTFGVRTDIIDDSGPGIGASGWPASWGVRLPVDCSYCAVGLSALFLYDRAAHPDTRFAFLSFATDDVLAGFYGASPDDVVGWLLQFESSFDGLLNTRSFVANGTGHVVMASAIDRTTKAALATWLTKMVNDDPTWESDAP